MMTPDEFREQGHKLIDWIAGYMAHPEHYPVLSRSTPGEIRDQLPTAPPSQGEPMDDIFADFESVIMPGITHWNHPGFMAYFANTASGPAILGELLSVTLNVNAMLWRTSPAATELEETALDWLRQMVGLPAEMRGVIMDGASMASMVSIAAAREALNLDIRQQGMAGRDNLPRLRAYTSEQAHSSIEKGAMVLGIGQEGVRKIPTDAEFRMDPQALAQAIEEDLAAGWRPFYVAATVGTTSSTSIDPIPAIAEICKQHGLWLHVDGAYGGVAAVVPELRHVLNGAEHADSIVINPHKWLFVPVDLSAFYVRDPQALQRAFSLVPEYLRTSETEVTNYMDWGVQLGRRFRALKLWFVLRHFGTEGCAAAIREHVRLGQYLAQLIDASPDFERLAPTPYSTVCFRACPQDLAAQLASDDADHDAINAYLDQLNEGIINAVNATGDIYISHTKLNGLYTIRVAIGNLQTSEYHVNRVWELAQQAAAELDREMRP